MTKRQRILLFSSLGLLLTAFVLLSLNRYLPPVQLSDKQVQQKVLDWQTFPTRAQYGPSSAQADEYDDLIRLAILRQEYDTAYSIISEAEELFPEDVRIWQHKTRLAYAQNNYDEAEMLIWDVIGLDPTNAINWAFAETIFSHNGKPEIADQALSIALDLNPDLASHLFQERWQLAVHNKDNEKLTELADEHYLLHADDPLAEYYLAEALRSSGQDSIALYLLVGRLAEETQSPAVLWFTLGQTYLDIGSYKESATALEHAQDLFNAGDTSMLLAAKEPANIILDNLAKAYLGTQRCLSAEVLFRRLAAETGAAEYSSWIKKAVTCQTPTPTPTHWMISMQRTPTPAPN